MAKKKTKKSKSEVRPPDNIRKVIRSFAVAHVDGYSHSQLEILQAYIQDNFHLDYKEDKLMKMIRHEESSLKKEPVLRNIDSILFSGEGGAPNFKLGSSFCEQCGMFKNYRKECPYCGYHEVTL